MEYQELYEYVRKEKYGEQLQTLPKAFISDIGKHLAEKRSQLSAMQDMFSEEALRLKKQYENTLALFKDLIQRRKKKLLSLVFVASETGLMKRDTNALLSFEQQLFDRLLLAVESADKDVAQLLSGQQNTRSDHKLVLISNELSSFVDMSGTLVGPFSKGSLVNLEANVADILVADGKASFIDE